MARRGYVGWELSEADRNRLRAVFPAVYQVDPTIQHHVTLAFGVNETYPLPTATKGIVVGVADDGRGVQALVVEIDGRTTRDDGSIYHVTWSLDRRAGRKPVESNEVLRNGWTSVKPVEIALLPRFFTF